MSNLLTVTEAAAKLRLSKQTLYQRVSQGTIPHVKLGARLLFDEGELERWVDGQRVPVLGAPPVRP